MNTDPLAEYLDSLQREDCYRTDCILKETPAETTQIVSFVGANGSTTGPFVRKYIKHSSGMGVAYERIREAQQNGERFKSIPTVIECYLHDEDLVVIMEYLPGETLQDTVGRRGPSFELAADVFPRLCDAVLELHEGFDPPIIHRDLKPSNVILSGRSLSIIDFGIAREYREGAESDTSHFGTRSFAPPEQFGFGQTTVRSDVYALGMILYYCLTGSTLSASSRDSDLASSDIVEPIRDVIRTATAFDPENRYASCTDLKGAFLVALRQCTPDPASTAGPLRRNISEPTPVAASSRKTPRTIASAPNASLQDTAPSAKSPWGARNVIVTAITLTFLAVDVSCLFTPRANTSPDPVLYNFLTYGPFGITFFLACGYLALDKKRLATRFPLFGKVKSWHLWALCGVILLITAAIVVATGISPQ